jgi:hypothetical protein
MDVANTLAYYDIVTLKALIKFVVEGSGRNQLLTQFYYIMGLLGFHSIIK